MRNIPLLGSAQFVFEVPVYKGIEIDANQTVEANDVKMTLKKMTVNRSHTEMLMCFDMPTAQDWRLWMITIRIGDSPECQHCMAANAITGDIQGDYGLDAQERCIELGFDAPRDGKATVITVSVPYLVTSVPEIITDEWVAKANEELEPLGIAFEYVPAKRDVMVLQRPAGIEE